MLTIDNENINNIVKKWKRKEKQILQQKDQIIRD